MGFSGDCFQLSLLASVTHSAFIQCLLCPLTCRRGCVVVANGRCWQTLVLCGSGSSRPRNQSGVSCIAGGFFTNWAMKEASEWSEVSQSCPTLCDPMDCRPPGSSIHGIFQARVVEWVAISFSRGSSWPMDPWIEPGSPAMQADALPSEPYLLLSYLPLLSSDIEVWCTLF